MNTTSVMMRLTVPATTWAEICRLEPRLRDVEELIDLTDRGETFEYYAIRNYASCRVGWARGKQAPDEQSWSLIEEGWTTLDGLADDIVSEPLTDAERWLRTSEAYDVALDHLIDRPLIDRLEAGES